jgi:hypothetical protein
MAVDARREVAADPAHDADIVTRLVVAYAHAIGVGSLPWTVDECASGVWDFCRAGLWRTPGPGTGPTR